MESNKIKKKHATSSPPSSRPSLPRSSPSCSLGYLFGPPKEQYYSASSSSAPSHSSGSTFGSIFPPPSVVLERDPSHGIFMGSRGNQDLGNQHKILDNYEQTFKMESNQHEIAEPCYLSSSIYYGGQENYSPRTRTSHQSPPDMFKRDGADDDDDSNGSNSDSASRGNWWKGSLYY